MMWPWTRKKLIVEYEILCTIGKDRRTKDQTIRIRELAGKLSPITWWTRFWFRWKRRNDPLYIELKRMKKELGI